MDPSASRQMWSVISKLNNEHTVILTTHSMEEAEAICDRIGILAKGALKCLGNSQHLKAKFGSGYEVKLRATVSSVTLVIDRICGELSFKLIEQNDVNLTLQSICSTIDLSAAFTLLEELKAKGAVVEYSVSQSTLDQIFVRLVEQDKVSHVAVAVTAVTTL